LHNWPDTGQWEWGELVLLEEIVEVLLQHFKHQTCVIFVLEALIGPYKVELLGILVA
jgi:hypothetical protein